MQEIKRLVLLCWGGMDHVDVMVKVRSTRYTDPVGRTASSTVTAWLKVLNRYWVFTFADPVYRVCGEVVMGGVIVPAMVVEFVVPESASADANFVFSGLV